MGEAMDSDVQKMRDELLHSQVKGTRSLYLGLTIAYGACVALTVAFAVGILVQDKGLAVLVMDLGMMAGSAASAMHWWRCYKEAAAALEEIGDDPTGIDTCRAYSLSTAQIIAGSRKTANELMQQWIAYGIIAISMLLCAALFVALLLDSFEDELLFVFCGAFMLAGGLLLLSMAIEAWREWLVTRRIDRFDALE